MKKNEIILFENESIKLEVNMQDETAWLNRQQIAELFNRDIKTISKHINNSLKDELNDEVVVAKFATTTKHGAIKGKTQTHQVEYYNLDVIISVGYRVKSKSGIAFRKWANKVLKEYLISGYAINQKRLNYLEKTVKLIDIATRIDTHDVKNVLQVINNYSKALDVLDDYDHKKISKPKGSFSLEKISYADCLGIIRELKFNEKSELFALERDKGLHTIISSIYQSFDNKDLYAGVEEKAANFLYMIIKDHVFIDGNKRIAATLFIYFLFYYDILYNEGKPKIDNNTLATLTLLIAQSNPKEKEILIDLVISFLVN